MCTIDLSKLKNAVQLKYKLIVPALINLLLSTVVGVFWSALARQTKSCVHIASTALPEQAILSLAKHLHQPFVHDHHLQADNTHHVANAHARVQPTHIISWQVEGHHVQI